MPGASLPGRAAPYTPPLTSARAWRCPPCLVLVPSVPLCPLHLGTSCRPSPLVLPHGACFLPAPPPRLPRARSQPSPIEGHQPPPRFPPAPAPAHPVGSGRCSGPAALGPGSARTWSWEPAPGTKAARRHGPPLGPGPATCPGECLSGRQRGWGWRAGVERASGINHFAAGGAAQPGALSSGAEGLRCPLRSARGQIPRSPCPRSLRAPGAGTRQP